MLTERGMSRSDVLVVTCFFSTFLFALAFDWGTDYILMNADWEKRQGQKVERSSSYDDAKSSANTVDGKSRGIWV